MSNNSLLCGGGGGGLPNGVPGTKNTSAGATKTGADALSCSTCGTPQTETMTLLKCQQCKSVQYCDKTCQKKHWKKHKKECKHLMAEKKLKKTNTFVAGSLIKARVREMCQK